VKVKTLLEGAAIRADGVSVGTAPLDIPVYFEPGEHRLEARKGGAEPVSRTVTLTAGQELVVDLSPEPATPASAPTVEPPPSAPPPASAPVAETESAVPPAPAGPDPVLVERRRKKTLWAWISLGAGGALALTAAVLYGVGGAQSSDAHDRYEKEKDPQKIESAWSDVESAQNKVIAGHVMAGLAAVGIGFAVYQFLTRPDVERQARLTITPLASGAALHGRF
jgi:hypothetical protein